MSSLWVPPRVSESLSDESLRRQTVALNAAMTDESPWLRAFNRRLGDEIEHGVELIFCPDPAPVELVSIGAAPGRWGVLVPGKRGGPASVIALKGDDGGFVEPGEFVFDWLRANDWQNPAVMRERALAQEREKEAKLKVELAERERMNDEVLEAYLAGTRAQVSLNTDTPWAQNAKGYQKVRGKKG